MTSAKIQRLNKQITKKFFFYCDIQYMKYAQHENNTEKKKNQHSILQFINQNITDDIIQNVQILFNFKIVETVKQRFCICLKHSGMSTETLSICCHVNKKYYLTATVHKDYFLNYSFPNFSENTDKCNISQTKKNCKMYLQDNLLGMLPITFFTNNNNNKPQIHSFILRAHSSHFQLSMGGSVSFWVTQVSPWTPALLCPRAKHLLWSHPRTSGQNRTQSLSGNSSETILMSQRCCYGI